VFPATTSTGIVRLADPTQRVGVTFAMTFLYAVSRVSFYSAVWLFQPALMASVLQGKRGTRAIVLAQDRLLLFLCAFAACLGIAPMFCLGVEDQTGSVRQAVWYLIFCGTAAQLVGLGCVAMYGMRKVSKVLDASNTLNPSAKTIKIKVRSNDVWQARTRCHGRKASLLSGCVLCLKYSSIQKKM